MAKSLLWRRALWSSPLESQVHCDGARIPVTAAAKRARPRAQAAALAFLLTAGLTTVGCVRVEQLASPDLAWEHGELNVAALPAGGHRPAGPREPEAPRAAPAPARTARKPVAPPARVPAAPSRLPAAPADDPAPRGDEALRAAQRLEAARVLLGTPGPTDRAFIAQVLRAAGQDLAVDRSQPYAAALWDRLGPGKRLTLAQTQPGDLVFFRDTEDVNDNGKPDDGVTMVGLVEAVSGSRVVLIAQRAGKVRRMALDSTKPHEVRSADDTVLNTRLVRWPGHSEPWTTGECWHGYARP